MRASPHSIHTCATTCCPATADSTDKGNGTDYLTWTSWSVSIVGAALVGVIFDALNDGGIEAVGGGALFGGFFGGVLGILRHHLR